MNGLHNTRFNANAICESIHLVAIPIANLVKIPEAGACPRSPCSLPIPALEVISPGGANLLPEPEAFVADGEVLAVGRPVYGGQNASYEHETRMQLIKCQAVRGRLGVSLLGIPLQLLLHLVPGSSLELPAPSRALLNTGLSILWERTRQRIAIAES